MGIQQISKFLVVLISVILPMHFCQADERPQSNPILPYSNESYLRWSAQRMSPRAAAICTALKACTLGSGFLILDTMIGVSVGNLIVGKGEIQRASEVFLGVFGVFGIGTSVMVARQIPQFYRTYLEEGCGGLLGRLVNRKN